MGMVGSSGWASWRRIGGVAGIVFGLGTAVLLSALFAGAPTIEDPVREIRSYFADDASTYFVLTWFVALLFVGVFLLFASALRSVLASEDIDAGVWSRASFAGAVATVAVAGAGTAFWSALALNGPEAFSDSTVLALMSLDAVLFGSIMPWGLAVFLTGASVVILRSGVLWKGLGWLGLGAALVMVISVFWVLDGDIDGPLASVGLVGVFAMFLWALLTGIAMIRMEEAA
jgi:hypothetical protein